MADLRCLSRRIQIGWGYEKAASPGIPSATLIQTRIEQGGVLAPAGPHPPSSAFLGMDGMGLERPARPSASQCRCYTTPRRCDPEVRHGVVACQGRGGVATGGVSELPTRMAACVQFGGDTKSRRIVGTPKRPATGGLALSGGRWAGYEGGTGCSSPPVERPRCLGTPGHVGSCATITQG